MPTEFSPSMTSDELRIVLEELDVAQSELARACGCGRKTAQRWVAENGSVPGPVAVLVKLLRARPELQGILGISKRNASGRRPVVKVTARE